MSLVAELQRRRVFRALVGYGIAAFAILQIIEPIMHGLHWPDAVLSYVVVALAIGFPIVVTLAWIFDVKSGGIERAAPASSTSPRGTRLALLLVAIGALAATPGLVWYLVIRGGARTTRGSGATVPPSIAVLPFVNLSSDKEQEYFSDGLAEELLNLLGQVPGLHVAARTSAFAFKGKNVKISEIGHELGVATVLEGSVRKSGDQIRITTQLINAADGFHLWSQTYDRKLIEVFAVQDEIARAVVAALKLQLLPAPAEPQTASPEAHDLYLLGLHFIARGSTDGFAHALEALEKAVALDPRFGAAWAALAWARFWASDSDPVRHQSARFIPAAQEAAGKAIALSPGLADGWVARGALRLSVNKDWAGARSDLERALSLSPSNSNALGVYARLLGAFGNVQQAIAALRKATAADPLSPNAWIWLSLYQLGAGELEAAEVSAARAIQISPDSTRGLRTLGFARLLRHRLDEAQAAFDAEKDDGASGTLFQMMGNALVQFERGNLAESQRFAEAIIANPVALGASYQIAEVLAWQGNAAGAFKWLEKAYQEHDPGLNYLKFDPLLRKVRGQPRFAALLRKMNLPPD